MVIRFSALALLIAVVAISCSSTSADERPGAHNRYASAEEQRQWQDELTQESAVATRVGFDPLGEVRSVAGVFTIRRGGAAPWLLAHRKMLGLPQNAKVEVVGREPFFRFDGDTDRRVGDRYVYRVEYKGFPFVGKELSVIVDLKGTLVLGPTAAFRLRSAGSGRSPSHRRTALGGRRRRTSGLRSRTCPPSRHGSTSPGPLAAFPRQTSSIGDWRASTCTAMSGTSL